MTIQVFYFASLSEQLGKIEDQLISETPITAAFIWQQLNPQQVMPDNTLVAINQNYAKLDDLVQANDELAFFPPVTGG
ncbi:MAG TPA: MoaD/ThiS family protein [Thiothrix sp.]|nr:MoaD/ThiS family protein [Thiothrix sp.]